jgi:hypothetical protein
MRWKSVAALEDRRRVAGARVYSASQIDDLRAPLTSAWTSAGLVAWPAAALTRITFPAPGAQPGDTFDRQVSLTVTDADGFQAAHAVTVEVEVIEIPDDTGVGDVPSIWFPECREAS